MNIHQEFRRGKKIGRDLTKSFYYNVQNNNTVIRTNQALPTKPACIEYIHIYTYKLSVTSFLLLLFLHDMA